MGVGQAGEVVAAKWRQLYLNNNLKKEPNHPHPHPPGNFLVLLFLSLFEGKNICLGIFWAETAKSILQNDHSLVKIQI